MNTLKVVPKICNYLKSKPGLSVLQYKKPNITSLKNLHLDKDAFVKNVDKVASKPSKTAIIFPRYEEGGTAQYGQIDDNYVKTRKVFIEGYEYTPKFGPKKGILQKVIGHYEDEKIMLPHYHICFLRSGGPGTGTRAVQGVVEDSLKNAKTSGRVTLLASKQLEGELCPAGFYYKLGFRFKDPAINEKFAKWLQEGGIKEKAPQINGEMFLPTENIQHCLNYGKH